MRRGVIGVGCAACLVLLGCRPSGLQKSTAEQVLQAGGPPSSAAANHHPLATSLAFSLPPTLPCL